jgi:diketogulonate reductase-like aldo/keto reductase
VPDSLVTFCQQNKIQANSYAPLGTPDHMSFFPERMPVLLLENDVVREIATQTNRSPAQVLIRWALQRGVVVNPRTNSIDVRCHACLF